MILITVVLPTLILASALVKVLKTVDFDRLEKFFWSKQRKSFYKNDAINGSRFPGNSGYDGRESDLEATWAKIVRIKKYIRKNPDAANLPDLWVEKLVEGK